MLYDSPSTKATFFSLITYTFVASVSIVFSPSDKLLYTFINSFTLNEMTYFIENGIPYTANIVNTYTITEKNVNVVNKVSFLRNYSTGSINGDLSNNRLYIITIIGYKT